GDAPARGRRRAPAALRRPSRRLAGLLDDGESPGLTAREELVGVDVLAPAEEVRRRGVVGRPEDRVPHLAGRGLAGITHACLRDGSVCISLAHAATLSA